MSDPRNRLPEKKPHGDVLQSVVFPKDQSVVESLKGFVSRMGIALGEDDVVKVFMLGWTERATCSGKAVFCVHGLEHALDFLNALGSGVRLFARQNDMDPVALAEGLVTLLRRKQ